MAAQPVPVGWRLRPAAGLRSVRDGEVLLGGAPLRLLTLSPIGARVVAGWFAGQPVGEALEERLLARRLLDAGLCDPLPVGVPVRSAEVTVIVPVHGDADRLRACLAALGGGWPAIVIDDGSPDAEAIARVARDAGARLVRHDLNRGPSAARNTGLRLATTPLVAFLDCDCVPSAAFPSALIAHMDDPSVALAAPRIVSPAGQRGRFAEYERRRSKLDMGARPSLARPFSPVWYVPSAALVARRDALGAGFDEQLDIGEDVDLVWRLHDAGWQTRYDPRVTVAHDHRVRPLAWYLRRVFYNGSVAPLSRRHPTRVPTVYLSPAATVAWLAALIVHPLSLVALTIVRGVRLERKLSARMPRAAAVAARISVEQIGFEGRDLARAFAGPWAPLAVAAAVVPRRRGPARRLVLLLAAWLLGDWLSDRSPLDPASYGVLRLADESARGVGVWLGCARLRDFRPLLPSRPPAAADRDFSSTTPDPVH
ncbi:MAG TPA: mycofactocin biosynthesis glycosyltransferase MftF [Solirubrobacteraceae bacterium]|jgi:mycofactocin system glycosyltransferase